MLPADSPFASLPAPGPHPATAELRAYAAGTMNPPDEHRVEAHALDCARCTELLTGFSMSDAATTDQALAGLRSRLQARVADDVPAPFLLPAIRPLWSRLAAAVALLGALGGGIWGWEQQHPTTEVATAPSTTATPAAGPQLASPAAVATAKLPQTIPPTRPAATTSDAAPGQLADYAAVRPRSRAAAPRLFRRPAQPAASVLADSNPDASKVFDGFVSQAAPAVTEAKKLAGRAAAPPASEPATSLAAAEAAAPKTAAALESAAPAKALAMADSSATGQQEVIISRFSKAKAFESVALAREKPMPAAMAIAPAPVAGTPAMHDYLHREAAKFELEEGAKPLHGTVRLRFIVGADGKLSNLQVVRGMRVDYDEEALRMVCEGPVWRPGIAGGRRAALPMEITISF